MNCERVTREEIADKYLSGQLDSALRDEFEIHILECQGCLELVEAYEAVRTELAARADEIRLKPSRKFSQFRLVWVPVAAVLAVAIGFAVTELGIPRAPLTPQQQSSPNAQQEAETVGPPQAGTASIQMAAKAPASQQRTTEAQRRAAVGETPARSAKPTGATAEAALQSRPSETAREVPPAQADKQPTTAVVAADSTQQKPKPQPGAARSDDVVAELFRLGMVDPPVYTFAGFQGKPMGPAAAGQGYSGMGVADGRSYFQEAMLAYVEGHYESAAALLEDARHTEPKAPDINFYLGICRLMRGSSAEAVKALTVATGKRSPLLQSAHFYLAKAYIQTDNLAQAEDQLQAAIAVPGRLSAEAKSLLGRLRAVRSKLHGETKAAPKMIP